MSTGLRPLAEEVREVLSDEVLTGQLPPGSRLDETVLTERFGVSRTPVREALRQMASAGLVEHRHRRGVFVVQVPQQRLAEMFEYAAEMEAACTFLAAMRMMPDEREALLSVHLASYECVRDGDINGYDCANRNLHETIFRGCHNRYLFEAALSARSKVTAYRRVQFHVNERPSDSFSSMIRLLKLS
ncbi:GntR family transcriptional regulator [Alkalilimnicola ehrlichii]|uniref:GntR family transcriptional regulator n=1 Tax=Alkalilimnicola ehrlichii TaxID=351052 RepID=UPI001C6E1048|nr:GntR family transcriptional regulator [Alkalilimnicola ehrlichii]